MRAYIDSDVLIWHLRGEKKALRFFTELSQQTGVELWVGALQRMEVVFFMKPVEIKETLRFLSHFKTQAVTQEIVDKGGELFRKWNPSHGIDINDAVLAATVEVTGGTVYTLNKKHYPMPHVHSVKGWE